MARPRKRARAVVARRCGRRSCVRSAARAPMPRPTWARRQAAALALRVERQQRGPWRGRRNTAAAPSCHRRACGRSSARAPRSTRALRPRARWWEPQLRGAVAAAWDRWALLVGGWERSGVVGVTAEVSTLQSSATSGAVFALNPGALVRALRRRERGRRFDFRVTSKLLVYFFYSQRKWTEISSR